MKYTIAIPAYKASFLAICIQSILNQTFFDADFYRKPNIGMALQAKKDFPDLEWNKCLMIGDSETDMRFAMQCKMKGVKI
ncbi:HAD hydrolase-like protein [uncultured Bacteroides sp.]|uniref:HAD hydrolase-like protein n=1 Tax=uncultured Bacteroides sp. TaxID=162156 RepID=UPI002AA9008B|nr:HAD hydrolase-like protein [uncultured Bacteroides sp.]